MQSQRDNRTESVIAGFVKKQRQHSAVQDEKRDKMGIFQETHHLQGI